MVNLKLLNLFASGLWVDVDSDYYTRQEIIKLSQGGFLNTQINEYGVVMYKLSRIGYSKLGGKPTPSTVPSILLGSRRNKENINESHNQRKRKAGRD